MRPSILETPGGTRHELSLHEQRLLRLKPQTGKSVMERSRDRTLTIRYAACSLDRTIGAVLAVFFTALASWVVYETHENTKAIAILVDHDTNRDRATNALGIENHR